MNISFLKAGDEIIKCLCVIFIILGRYILSRLRYYLNKFKYILINNILIGKYWFFSALIFHKPVLFHPFLCVFDFSFVIIARDGF